nr:secreted Ly-6/uPAR domain-containing protein 2 isoform X3 [Halichoerus grypus]
MRLLPGLLLAAALSLELGFLWGPFPTLAIAVFSCAHVCYRWPHPVQLQAHWTRCLPKGFLGTSPQLGLPPSGLTFLPHPSPSLEMSPVQGLRRVPPRGQMPLGLQLLRHHRHP